jgi:hypothetical protein
LHGCHRGWKKCKGITAHAWAAACRFCATHCFFRRKKETSKQNYLRGFVHCTTTLCRFHGALGRHARRAKCTQNHMPDV